MSNNKVLNVKSLKEMLCIIPGVMYAEKIQEWTEDSCETHRLYYTEKAYKEIENLLYNSSYNDDCTMVTMKHKIKEDNNSLLYEGGIIYGVQLFKTYTDQRLATLKKSNPKTSWRSVINFVDYTSVLNFYPIFTYDDTEFDKNIIINHSEVLVSASDVKMYKNVFRRSHVNLVKSNSSILNRVDIFIKEAVFTNVTMTSDLLKESITYVDWDDGTMKCGLKDDLNISLYIRNSFLLDSKIHKFKDLTIVESTMRDCIISGISYISNSILKGLDVISVCFHSKTVTQPRLFLYRSDSETGNRYYSGHSVIGLGPDSVQVVSYNDQISRANVIGNNKTSITHIPDLTLELLDNPNTNLTLYNTDPNRLSINKRFKDFIKYAINKITL